MWAIMFLNDVGTGGFTAPSPLQYSTTTSPTCAGFAGVISALFNPLTMTPAPIPV